LQEKRYKQRETLCGLVAVFSLLILSAYIVLWKESNRDWLFRASPAVRHQVIAGTAFVLFVLGVVFSPRRNVVIAAAFLFSAIRWGIVALITWEPRAIIAALGFCSIPILLLIAETRQQSTGL
jgi:hypothetical protein